MAEGLLVSFGGKEVDREAQDRDENDKEEQAPARAEAVGTEEDPGGGGFCSGLFRHAACCEFITGRGGLGCLAA